MNTRLLLPRNVITFLIILLPSLCLYSQKKIIFDTSASFNGDIKIWVTELGNGSRFVKLMPNDSTYLYKYYAQGSDQPYLVYQCDLSGNKNGAYFFLDTVSKSRTSSINRRGRVIESFTIDSIGDTISFKRQIAVNDFECMEVKNTERILWHLDTNNIYNGVYRIYDARSLRIKVEGQYSAIRETDVLDKKKYKAHLKKYNLAYTFRGQTPMTEIPVGKWTYYDESGSVIKTTNYLWDGSVKF